VLNDEAKELGRVAGRIKIPARIVRSGSAREISKQVVFSTSQWFLTKAFAARLKDGHFGSQCRTTFAYFHGRPTKHNPEFQECLDTFRSQHHHIARAQVSNKSMLTLLLNEGIPPEKLALIPIGINLADFPRRTPEQKRAARLALNIPESAQVVGSFQKDGNGWGEGLEPKLIKGPDVFLDVMRALKPRVPNLFVLLSGPSRGYVKQGLQKLGIPYRHAYLASKTEVAGLFRAVDVTLVTSRDEGGPKAVLESMASGVPLVTTKVGQAADLVVSGTNAWMAEIEDVEALAFYTSKVLGSSSRELQPLVTQARLTAEANSYDSQTQLWKSFFSGVIE
jgi:glycosyltransferase involved in cell wall biosynthesis